MNVVVHKDPGENGAFAVAEGLAKTFQKKSLVLIVSEYVRFVDSPHHDMMQGTGDIQPRLAWHGAILSNVKPYVN